MHLTIQSCVLYLKSNDLLLTDMKYEFLGKLTFRRRLKQYIFCHIKKGGFPLLKPLILRINYSFKEIQPNRNR